MDSVAVMHSRVDKVRLFVYPIALMLVAALLYLGFLYKPEPDIGTLLNGAELMAQLGMLDQAEYDVDRAMRREPENLQGLVIKGFIVDRRGRLDEAAALYRRALEVNTHEEFEQVLSLAVANIERRKKNFKTSNDECRKILARWPTNAIAFHLLAENHRDLGELDTALEWALKAVTLDPKDADLYRSLGEVYLARNEKERSLQSVEQAAALEPRLEGIWYRVAVLRAESGDRQGAIDALEQAVTLYPKYVRDHLRTDTVWGSYEADDAFKRLVHP